MFGKKMNYTIEMVTIGGKSIVEDPNFYYGISGISGRGRVPHIGEKIEVHLGNLFSNETKDVYMTVKDVLTPLEGLPRIVVESSELKDVPFIPKDLL